MGACVCTHRRERARFAGGRASAGGGVFCLYAGEARHEDQAAASTCSSIVVHLHSTLWVTCGYVVHTRVLSCRVPDALRSLRSARCGRSPRASNDAAVLERRRNLCRLFSRLRCGRTCCQTALEKSWAKTRTRTSGPMHPCIHASMHPRIHASMHSRMRIQTALVGCVCVRLCAHARACVCVCMCASE